MVRLVLPADFKPIAIILKIISLNFNFIFSYTTHIFQILSTTADFKSIAIILKIISLNFNFIFSYTTHIFQILSTTDYIIIARVIPSFLRVGICKSTHYIFVNVSEFGMF